MTSSTGSSGCSAWPVPIVATDRGDTAKSAGANPVDEAIGLSDAGLDGDASDEDEDEDEDEGEIDDLDEIDDLEDEDDEDDEDEIPLDDGPGDLDDEDDD